MESLSSIVDSHTRLRPDSEACSEVFEESEIRSFTYADLSRVSRGLASGLMCYFRDHPAHILGLWGVGICMDRGFDWYALYLAAIRIGIPVAPMTQDIPDQVTAAKRNHDILTSLNISLVIVDARTPGCVLDLCSQLGVLVVPFSALVGDPDSSSEPLSNIGSAPLAYLYTGGTTRASKCAIVSHQMSMHEMRGYPLVAPWMSHTDRVMQHSSTYWGATFLGQINIALAFGGSVIFCNNRTDLSPIVDRGRVSVLGVVPSQLGALTGTCCSLKTVFTWGEKLSKNIAKKWSQKIHLVELLVSTEYWLCLYALNGEDVFHILDVASVDIATRPVGSDAKKLGEELLIGGDCVTSFGYSDADLNARVFTTHDGKRYFASSDLVERVSRSTVRFIGRSDSMVKIGGEWKDLFVIEQLLRDTEGVTEAAIVSNANGRQSAYVALSLSFTSETMNRIRLTVNEQYIDLRFVHHLPRNTVTGKVDRTALTSTTPGHQEDPALIKRQLITALLWSVYTAGFCVIILLCSGVIGLLIAPQIGQFLILFDPSAFTRGYPKLKAAWVVRKAVESYNWGLRTMPASQVLIPLAFTCFTPLWVSLTLAAVGMTSLYSSRRSFAAPVFWTVAFYVGLGRQIERAEFWTPPSARKHFRRSVTEVNECRTCRAWEPLGPPLPHVESSLKTFAHESVQLESVQVDSIARSLPPPPLIQECVQVDDEEESVVSEIVGAACQFLRRPLTRSTALTAIDSLTAVEITNRLRDACGQDVHVTDVLGSASLGELRDRLDQSLPIPTTVATEKAEFACQLWGWGFPCPWVFELVDRPYLHYKSLQSALDELARRHPGLITTQIDPSALSYWMNETLVVVGLIRHFLSASPWARFLAPVVSWLGHALFQTWNRVRPDKRRGVRISWREAPWFQSESELREYVLMKKRKPNFFPPAEAQILKLKDRVFVRLYVTHAFSDGASVVPILKELNELYGAALDGREPVLSALPPSALAIQEQRLYASLTQPIDAVKPDSFYLCYNMDMTESGVCADSFGKIVLLHESFVLVAQAAAQRLAVPIDVLWLSATAAALCRLWDLRSHVELALVVPLRDGAHEAEVVGFLADQRYIDIPLVGELTTLNSVVQAVHSVRRKRDWKFPDPFSNCNRTLVNIVQASFPKNVPFRQELLLQQHENMTGSLYRPMELYIEQVDAHMWTLKARCRRREYSYEKFQKFVSIFKQVVVDMCANPNALLH